MHGLFIYVSSKSFTFDMKMALEHKHLRYSCFLKSNKTEIYLHDIEKDLLAIECCRYWHMLSFNYVVDHVFHVFFRC